MKSPCLLLITILFLSVSALAGAGCGSRTEISGTGTVRFITLEGGFYGIVADDGLHYDPINLGRELHEDGIRIRFKAEKRKDLASVHMWGDIIEIVEVARIGD